MKIYCKSIATAVHQEQGKKLYSGTIEFFGDLSRRFAFVFDESSDVAEQKITLREGDREIATLKGPFSEARFDASVDARKRGAVAFLCYKVRQIVQHVTKSSQCGLVSLRGNSPRHFLVSSIDEKVPLPVSLEGELGGETTPPLLLEAFSHC